MTLETYRRAVTLTQVLLFASLLLVAAYNVASLVFDLPSASGWLIWALPGLALLGSGLVRLIPRATHYLTRPHPVAYRLLYNAPEDWDDTAARTALHNLARHAGSLDIVWSIDGAGIACHLAIPNSHADALTRLVAGAFPGGELETDPLPQPGEGATLLRIDGDMPAPATLCQSPGIEGVYCRYLGPQQAIVSLWGAQAVGTAIRLTGKSFLPGGGKQLTAPAFRGDNPWPGLPPFPSSAGNSGLTATARLHFPNPHLALREPQHGVVLGTGTSGEAIGLPLATLRAGRAHWLLGAQATGQAAQVALTIIRRKQPLVLVDQAGRLVVELNRGVATALARGTALVTDLERPAQAGFRLNPFWLPADTDYWQETFTLWLTWLRRLGVTRGGLGLSPYQHSVLAVILIAIAARERNLTFDPAGLADALGTPEFLTGLDLDASRWVAPRLWQWWLTDGKETATPDTLARLSHLRNRLNELLELPEYRMLWRAPWFEPADLWQRNLALLWRLPHRREHHRLYAESQLLALTTALKARPGSAAPVTVILHEPDVGVSRWSAALAATPGVRLLLAARQATTLLGHPRADGWFISRLNRTSANAVADTLDGVRPDDLRRLPATQAIYKRGKSFCTVETGNA